MARRWTGEEEAEYRKELYTLYVIKNKSIGEIGKDLDIAYQTVFDRLKRLGIVTNPQRKSRYLNKAQDVRTPSRRTAQLAEFFGVMLGDGHLSPTQVTVTLGNKEIEYVHYIQHLVQTIFGKQPRVSIRPKGYRTVYLGSVKAVRWLEKEGLVHHKVRAQVDVPPWIFTKPVFMKSFLRGFFDTDGSVYKLRFGIQISLTNRSTPLLNSLHRMLLELGYKSSAVTEYCVYLTRQGDLKRFFSEIRPANAKHVRRYQTIKSVGTQVVNEDWL